MSELLTRWGRRVRRLHRAVVGYRALVRQYETDLATAEVTIGNLEVTIGKLSAELVLNRREYAALEVRGQELIAQLRRGQELIAELRAAVPKAYDAGQENIRARVREQIEHARLN